MIMTSTLHKTRVEADRPWQVALVAPETPIGEVTGRLAQIEAALVAFAPVLRPLSLSLERGWREPGTGLFVFDPASDPAMARFSAELSQFGARRQTLHATRAEETVGPVASPSAVRAWLAGACGPRGPRGRCDLKRLETTAAAVRLHGDALKVVGATRDPVVVPDGEARWVAGPIDEEGYGAWPPAKLVWDAEHGRLELEVSIHWTRWAEIGTPERAAIDAALMELEHAGWTSA